MTAPRGSPDPLDVVDWDERVPEPVRSVERRRDFDAVAKVLAPCQHEDPDRAGRCGQDAEGHRHAPAGDCLFRDRHHRFEQPRTVLVDFGGEGVIVDCSPVAAPGFWPSFRRGYILGFIATAVFLLGLLAGMLLARLAA